MANIKVSERILKSSIDLDFAKEDTHIIDTIVAEAAKRMQEEMDRHFMSMILKEDGWVEFTVDAWKHGSTSAIESWCERYIKFWYRCGNNFLFKRSEDATLFMLRWS